jgi:hypothetical protein
VISASARSGSKIAVRRGKHAAAVFLDLLIKPRRKGKKIIGDREMRWEQIFDVWDQ